MKMLNEVLRFHGHMCPGLAIGYRVSRLALKEMAGKAKDGELIAIVENDSCAVDAIQVMTDCTFGKGNLIFRDYGKQVYTFIRRDGRAVRVSVKWQAPQETPLEAKMWQRYMSGERTPAVLRAVHKRKSRKISSILEAQDRELFRIKRLKLKSPEEARIYKSIECGICREKVMESRARIKDGEVVCIPCSGGINEETGRGL